MNIQNFENSIIDLIFKIHIIILSSKKLKFDHPFVKIIYIILFLG